MTCQASAFALALLSGLALSAPITRAQAPGAIQATTGRVLLVNVLDSRGRPSVDFSVDDFVISEGGQDREIFDVHIADYPVAVLLDDTTDEETGRVIRAAASRFVTRIGERPVAVGVLSDGAAMIAGLEDDRRTVLERLNALESHPSAVRSPLPVVAAVSRLLHDSESPFSAVVVIAGAAVDASTLVPGDLLPGILESGAVVHVIEGRTPPSPDQNGPESPDLLKVLADQTHGQYTIIFSPLSYSIALDRLADRLSVEMMIEYLVPPGAAAGDARVGVKRPGARVLGLGVSK